MSQPHGYRALPAAHRNWLALVVVLVVAGCVGTPRDLDPEALWQRSSRRHADAVESIAELKQLQSDYQAIIRLDTEGELRGPAYVRLAEIDLALGENAQAGYHLEQALRAGLTPVDQRRVLLLLGDVMDRHLENPATASIAYQQVINEHPATPESELAALRLAALDADN